MDLNFYLAEYTKITKLWRVHQKCKTVKGTETFLYLIVKKDFVLNNWKNTFSANVSTFHQIPIIFCTIN